MITKHLSLFAAGMISAAIAFTSCDPDDISTVHKRSAHRVEFSRGDLGNTAVGSSLPSSVKAVDLGLSVMWSDMNLGAQSPEESGDLFAWGEIEPSGNYGWSSYEHNEFHRDDAATLYLTKYCFDFYGEHQDLDKGGVTLDRNDDAAYVMWGEHWRMPVISELEELSDKCTWTYDSSLMQFTVTGPSGNSITIPFPGVGIGSSVFGEPQGAVDGGIWSSSLSGKASPFAGKLTLVGKSENRFEKHIDRDAANRWVGCIIRPVYAE